jgi:exodeoxyribonuclease VII large subunit
MNVHEPDRLVSPESEQPDDEARPILRWGLRQFTAEAGKVIRSGLPGEVWVEAVILAVSRIGSGYTLDLIEPYAQNPSTSARLRGVLSSPVVEQLAEARGEDFDIETLRGSSAWVKIKPSFHPSRHLQANVSDLEPIPTADTLGQVLEEARLQLVKEGIFRRQRQLPAPTDILRIGIVHPERSAGYADVLSEIERLERTGIATSVSFPASFEGSAARQSLCAALELAGEVVRGEGLDVLLLVRGGGHSAGLASLVFDDVARLICTFPVPVITGLGHASDHTLLDEVAWRSTDTPSKAIRLVLDLIRERADNVMFDYHTIRKVIDRGVSQQLQLLQSGRDQILRDAGACIQQQEYQIESVRQTAVTCRTFLRSRVVESQQDLEQLFCELSGAPGGLAPPISFCPGPSGLFRAVLDRESSELKRLWRELIGLLELASDRAHLALQGLHQEVRALSIEGTLGRGFALVLDRNRRPVRHVAEMVSVPLTLTLADGTVTVRCEEPTISPN